MASQTSPGFKRNHAHLAKNTAIVVILIVAGFVLVCNFYHPHPISTPIPSNRILLNGTVTINSGASWSLPFIIPPNSYQIKVSGNFTVSGNNENYIRAYIMNESSFMINGRYSGAVYDSGQVAAANINVALPNGGGIYYLMFDNVFSNSQKEVDVQMNLSYFYVPS